MEEIKVSVVVPTYNCEKYISQTLDSILNQSHHNVEVLVVDDHSSDNTVNIVKDYMSKDNRVKLFPMSENLGAANSRNVALKNATGDYIAFLDGDDIWLEDKLEKQLKFMIDNHYDFSYTNYEEMDENGNPTGVYVSGPKKITHHGFNCMDYVGCLTVMYRREIYPDLQIPTDLPKNNDYAMWLLLSKKANCYLLDDNLAMYRRHLSGSISSGKKTNLFKYHIDLFKKVYGFSTFHAFLYSVRNVFFYFYKRLRYIKKK